MKYRSPSSTRSPRSSLVSFSLIWIRIGLRD